jgi:Fe-S-cluster-containing hydrogenase component 2
VSTTNRTLMICNKCKRTVPIGTGTIRHYNGSARKHAPKYAVRSAYGVFAACTCTKCEEERC